MKTVSNAYKAAMLQPLRNRSYVQILLENADRDTQSDGSWTSNGAMLNSETETLDYGGNHGNAYATLELNRWMLDGSTTVYDVLPTEDGFISSIMSDADGAVTTEPALTREFTDTHNLVGMTIQFDTRSEEWPVSAAVDFYLNSTIVDTVIINQVDSPTVPIVRDIEEFDKVVVRAAGLLPYRRFRVEKIMFGISRTYTNKDIIETVQTHNVDPITRRLPDEELSFTILDFEHVYDPDNPDGIYDYVDENSSVSIAFGYDVGDSQIEWLEPDQYVLTAKPTTQDGRVTFSAKGRVNMMADKFYKALHGTKTLKALAESVLIDAGLGKSRDGSDPWVIDASLANMSTTGVLPIDTHMNCLQLIAHAACCRLYTDDQNVIHIEPYNIGDDEIDADFWINDPQEHLICEQEDTSTQQFWLDENGHLIMTEDVSVALDFDSISERSQSVSKIDQLKAVTVAQYSEVVEEEAITLYEQTTTETELHIELPDMARNVAVSISGGTASTTNVYAQAVDLVMSEGTKTVTITGKPVKWVADYVTESINPSGETDTEENPLITTDALRVALTNHIATYLQYRNTYDFDYRGNPELEVGDVIGFQTRYSPGLIGIVLTDEITFNGAIHGHIKTKMLW